MVVSRWCWCWCWLCVGSRGGCGGWWVAVVAGDRLVIGWCRFVCVRTAHSGCVRAAGLPRVLLRRLMIGAIIIDGSLQLLHGLWAAPPPDCATEEMRCRGRVDSGCVISLWWRCAHRSRTTAAAASVPPPAAAATTCEAERRGKAVA